MPDDWEHERDYEDGLRGLARSQRDDPLPIQELHSVLLIHAAEHGMPRPSIMVTHRFAAEALGLEQEGDMDEPTETKNIDEQMVDLLQEMEDLAPKKVWDLANRFLRLCVIKGDYVARAFHDMCVEEKQDEIDRLELPPLLYRIGGRWSEWHEQLRWSVMLVAVCTVGVITLPVAFHYIGKWWVYWH